MIRNGQRSHVHLQKEGKMAYEIDFVGVGDECKKDADASPYVGKIYLAIIKLPCTMVGCKPTEKNWNSI